MNDVLSLTLLSETIESDEEKEESLTMFKPLRRGRLKQDTIPPMWRRQKSIASKRARTTAVKNTSVSGRNIFEPTYMEINLAVVT